MIDATDAISAGFQGFVGGLLGAELIGAKLPSSAVNASMGLVGFVVVKKFFDFIALSFSSKMPSLRNIATSALGVGVMAKLIQREGLVPFPLLRANSSSLFFGLAGGLASFALAAISSATHGADPVSKEKELTATFFKKHQSSINSKMIDALFQYDLSPYLPKGETTAKYLGSSSFSDFKGFLLHCLVFNLELKSSKDTYETLFVGLEDPQSEELVLRLIGFKKGAGMPSPQLMLDILNSPALCFSNTKAYHIFHEKYGVVFIETLSQNPVTTDQKWTIFANNESHQESASVCITIYPASDGGIDFAIPRERQDQ